MSSTLSFPFLCVAFASMLGYALHYFWFTAISRRFDALSLSFYRSLSLLFVMLPVLFFTTPTHVHAIFSPFFLAFFLVNGLMGGLGIACQFEANKYLPAGIVSAITRAQVIIVFILSYFLLSYFLFHEIPSLYQGIGIVLILVSTVALSLIRSSFVHLRDSAAQAGLLYIVPRVAGMAVWCISIAYLAAYTMEASVFVGLLVLVAGRYLFFRTRLSPIGRRDFGYLTLVNIPIIVATGGAAYATVLGPIGVVYTIAALQTVVIALLGHAFFAEHLGRRQWLYIAGTVVGSVILGIFHS